jgi:hypothetical protein
VLVDEKAGAVLRAVLPVARLVVVLDEGADGLVGLLGPDEHVQRAGPARFAPAQAAARWSGRPATRSSNPAVASATKDSSMRSVSTACASTARARSRSPPGSGATWASATSAVSLSTGSTTSNSLSSSLALSLIHRNITGCATRGLAPQTIWVSASGMSS